MSKIIRLLRTLYGIWFFASPIFSVLYLTLSSTTKEFFTPDEKAFLASTFFLVALLHLFLGSLWLGNLPKTFKALAFTILWPLFWMGLQRLFIPFSLMTYVVTIGLVYMMSLSIWFTVFIAQAVQKNPKEAWAGLLQLLFIIPALGATFIFGRYLILEQILPQAQGKTWAVYIMSAAFIVSVLQPVIDWSKRSDSKAQ